MAIALHPNLESHTRCSGTSTGDVPGPFCDRFAPRHQFLAEGGIGVAFKDAKLLNPGPLLVVRRRQGPDFQLLDTEEFSADLQMARERCDLLADQPDPDCFNLGVNIGTAGGQTVHHGHLHLHLHLHLIPRDVGNAPEPKDGVHHHARHQADEDQGEKR